MKRAQHSRWRSAWQSLLLAVLLCAQTGLLAHQFEHTPGLDDTPCAACSIGSQLQHGAVAQAQTPDFTGADTIAPECETESFISTAVIRATARAPPALH